VINPGGNSPDDGESKRLATALTTLGIAADVVALGQTPGATYDWCFVNNPHALGGQHGRPCGWHPAVDGAAAALRPRLRRDHGGCQQHPAFNQWWRLHSAPVWTI
jgi:hypothetical protein